LNLLYQNEQKKSSWLEFMSFYTPSLYWCTLKPCYISGVPSTLSTPTIMYKENVKLPRSRLSLGACQAPRLYEKGVLL